MEVRGVDNLEAMRIYRQQNEDKEVDLSLLVMPRYRITKYVEAKSIKEALRMKLALK